MNFGSRLKQLREERQWTRHDLANRIQASYSAIAKYESNARFPDQELLIQIADLFGTSIDYLVGKTDDPTPPGQQRKLTPEEQFKAMGVQVWARGGPLTDEDVKFISTYLETQRRLEEEKEKKKKL